MPFPLDSLAVPAAAWSTRRLRTDWTGAALRVRRSSDNVQADIGFDALGNLSVSALTSFVGAGSGYVVRLYDQSGNGRDAIQANTALQPIIVNAGAVVTIGLANRPAFGRLADDQTWEFTVQSSWFTGATAMTASWVQRNPAAAGKPVFGPLSFAGGNPDYPSHFPWQDNQIYADVFRSGGQQAIATVPALWNSISRLGVRGATASSRYYRNGTLVATYTAGLFRVPSTSVRFGAHATDPVWGNRWYTLTEMVLWTADVDLAALDADQALYFDPTSAAATRVSTPPAAVNTPTVLAPTVAHPSTVPAAASVSAPSLLPKPPRVNPTTTVPAPVIAATAKPAPARVNGATSIAAPAVRYSAPATRVTTSVEIPAPTAEARDLPIELPPPREARFQSPAAPTAGTYTIALVDRTTGQILGECPILDGDVEAEWTEEVGVDSTAYVFLPDPNWSTIPTGWRHELVFWRSDSPDPVWQGPVVRVDTQEGVTVQARNRAAVLARRSVHDTAPGGMVDTVTRAAWLLAQADREDPTGLTLWAAHTPTEATAVEAGAAPDDNVLDALRRLADGPLDWTVHGTLLVVGAPIALPALGPLPVSTAWADGEAGVTADSDPVATRVVFHGRPGVTAVWPPEGWAPAGYPLLEGVYRDETVTTHAAALARAQQIHAEVSRPAVSVTAPSASLTADAPLAVRDLVCGRPVTVDVDTGRVQTVQTRVLTRVRVRVESVVGPDGGWRLAETAVEIDLDPAGAPAERS